MKLQALFVLAIIAVALAMPVDEENVEDTEYSRCLFANRRGPPTTTTTVAPAAAAAARSAGDETVDADFAKFLFKRCGPPTTTTTAAPVVAAAAAA